jgi:hypothetical protein
MNYIQNFISNIKQFWEQLVKPLPIPYGGKITLKLILICFLGLIFCFALTIALGVIGYIVLKAIFL